MEAAGELAQLLEREGELLAGISEDRMTAVGFGETMPISSNASERGRAMNRRVEFIVTERGQ